MKNDCALLGGPIGKICFRSYRRKKGGKKKMERAEGGGGVNGKE